MQKLKKVRDVADLYCKSPPQCPNWAKRVLCFVGAEGYCTSGSIPSGTLGGQQTFSRRFE